LQRLGTIHIPHEIPLERWKILKGEMEAHAHQALGQVAAKRGNLRRAIAEFEMAAFNNPSPQGTQFLLLGSAHQMAGNIDAARKALLRAVELGPDEIRTLASNELRKLNEGNLDDRPDRKAP
jgi:tetratricopeptide (TPR) repeat protein